MKKIMVLMGLSIFIFSLVAIAQPRATPQERLKRLKEKLNLTEDQSVKIEKILVNADEQMKKLRADGNTNREDFRNLMDNTNQEIDKVLDEKQKIEHKKMMDERRNRRQQNPN